MNMQHGHAKLDMQQGDIDMLLDKQQEHAECTCSMETQHGHEAQTCGMDMQQIL
jgi:hypothetical protein